MLVKIKDFANSIYFIYAVAAVVALTWFTGWEVAGIVILALVAVTSLLLQRSCAPFLAITLTLPYCFSGKQIPDSYDLSYILQNYVWLAVIAAVVVLYAVFCIAYHLVKFPYAKEQRFNLSGSFVLCLIAITLAGLLSAQFDLQSNIFVLLMYAMVFVCYVVYSTGNVKNMKDFVAHVIVAAGLVIVFEAAVFYIRSGNLMEALEYKWIDLGWGTANNIATTFCFAIIAAVYLYLVKNKSAYFFMAVLFGIGELLMFSRGNLLSLGLSAPFLLWFIIAKSQNKKKTGILIGIVVAAVAVVAIVKWDAFIELSSTMLWDKGMFNADRRQLWGDYANMFSQNLFLGNGFYGYATVDGVLHMELLPHSVLLIIASGMGGAGLIIFGYHYYKKYLILFTYKSTFGFAVLFAAFYLFMYSSMDVNFFLPYQNLIILALLEAAKQEHCQLCAEKKEKELSPKLSAVFILSGIVLAVIATLYLINAPVLQDNGHYSLSEVPHFLSLALYMAGGVLVFLGLDKLQLHIQTKNNTSQNRLE